MPRSRQAHPPQIHQPAPSSPAPATPSQVPIPNSFHVDTSKGEAKLFRNGQEVRGASNFSFQGAAQKIQRAVERREAAQSVSPRQRRVRMESARQLASDFAREFGALDVHLSEAPPNLLGTMPHPAGTDIVKKLVECHRVEPCEWFSPGRMLFFVFQCPSDPSAWSRARSRLDTILEEITLAIPSAPLEAHLDTLTWWLRRIHLATQQDFYRWDGVLLTFHGTDRSGADGRWLYSKMGDFGSVISRMLDYMVRDPQGDYWDLLGLEAPRFDDLPALSDAAQKVLKVLQEAPPGEWVPRKTIATKINVAVGTVGRSLKSLKRAGMAIEELPVEGSRLSQAGR